MQKSNNKNPLLEVVKGNISKSPKGIKTPQTQKKFTKESKTVFIIGDSIIKGLAGRGISKDHNVTTARVYNRGHGRSNQANNP